MSCSRRRRSGPRVPLLTDGRPRRSRGPRRRLRAGRPSDADVAAMTAANRRLHFALYEASGRPRLVRLVRILWDATDVYRALYYARAGQPGARRGRAPGRPGRAAPPRRRRGRTPARRAPRPRGRARPGGARRRLTGAAALRGCRPGRLSGYPDAVAHNAWRDGRRAWERLEEWAARARSAGTSADGDAALDALDDVGQVRHLLDQAELAAVRLARRDLRSWTEIATRLGVTRQSAWERWRDVDDEGAPSAGHRQEQPPARGAGRVESAGAGPRGARPAPARKGQGPRRHRADVPGGGHGAGLRRADRGRSGPGRPLGGGRRHAGRGRHRPGPRVRRQDPGRRVGPAVARARSRRRGRRAGAAAAHSVAVEPGADAARPARGVGLRTG